MSRNNKRRRIAGLMTFLCVSALSLAAADTAAPGGGEEKKPWLEPPPYALNALEPYVSERTMSFHFGKHHQGYADNLRGLVKGTPLDGQPLERIIAESAGRADMTSVFNNSAQVWNHNFFWKSMKPGGGGKPSGKLLGMIEKSFGSFDRFKDAFTAAAVSQFGSGWVWLVQDGGTLKIEKTSNAETPVALGKNALLTCDVWEHAYYLDYQNRRKDFAQMFIDHLANWDFAESRLK
jgi:Fe-Mn family superoxide dismutase